MDIDQRFDFSPQSIPQSWQEAADDAPEGTGRAQHSANRPGTVRPMPDRQAADLFNGTIVGILACLIGGFAWYQFEMAAGTSLAWTAPVLGVLLAVSIRLGAGPVEAHTRAALAMILYLATASVVVFLVARTNYANLYGSVPGLADFEQELLRGRLTDPLVMIGWLGGAVGTAFLSYRLT